MLTLRHFLFYMGVACAAGAIVGAVAGLMDWSTGLIYAVGLPTGIVIVLAAVREGLFTSAGQRDQRHLRPHAQAPPG
jgi:hypothetical protein